MCGWSAARPNRTVPGRPSKPETAASWSRIGLSLAFSAAGQSRLRGRWRCRNYLRTLRKCSISWSVQRTKQVLTLLLLANWFACVVHCQLGQARLVGSLAKDSRPSFQAASPGNSGEECHICQWVATGGYKASDSRLAGPELVPVLMPAFTPAPQHELPPKQSHFAEWSTPPPDLGGTFLFVCRTALPARAPSFDS